MNETLRDQRFERAIDPQGRLIAANAELMVLELIPDRNSAAFQSTLDRLSNRVKDYGNPALAGSQRCFLMREVQKISPTTKFPTLAAEELAGEFATLPSPRERDDASPVLRRTTRAGLWQFTVQGYRVTALIGSDTLLAAMRPVLNDEGLPPEAQIELLPPDAELELAFVSLSTGGRLPGWQLALSDPQSLNIAASRQTSVYLWTGILMMAGTGVLALLAMRLLRRQTALARLKNDLAATVSHELKTPLSSMRVLVDTLLDSDRIDEQRTREYLQLIARENERLSRLIQNFLTFSRMERDKYTFHFSSVPTGQVIDAVIEGVRGRFNEPGCRFEVQAEENLPDVMADLDALTTALINLLDNAHKYSEDIKHIVLSAHAENGNLNFSVRDNGIGIAARDREKIFHAFHQADLRLSRKGSGCGLGLSIVRFIVAAHQGHVSVESEPGRGSTFTISVPALATAADVRKEAIA